MSIVHGRFLLGEDDALEANNILYRGLDLLSDRKSCPFQPSQKLVAGSIRHQVVMSEGHEENEGSVNETDAHSSKTKAE
jgi:hypothetical protein